MSAEPRSHSCAVERLAAVEDGIAGCFLDVQASGEGFGASAGEDDCAGGGAGGEVGEEGWEFVPHSIDGQPCRKAKVSRLKVGRTLR